jgi:rhodanese-related sulfurtransferase
MAKVVDARTLKQWLEQGEAVLIDVREPAEHRAEHIEGANLLPLARVRAASLPDRPGKKLVVHCLKGGRGSQACQKLLAEDPSLEVYNLEGGISAWSTAGFPVERSGSFLLPLDRQVQLTIGICVLAATALAYFVHPIFMLIAAVIGTGLIIAGLTGFCGLARLMALMPWNQRTA